MLLRAIERAGFVPGDEMSIALDVAASQFGRGGRYRLSRDGRELDRDGMMRVAAELVAALSDRLDRGSAGRGRCRLLAGFTAAVGGDVQVVGDDFLVTNAGRIAAAAADGACNAALIKPNQAGTLSEAEAAVTGAARSAGWGAIVSARSGESEDTTIVHLAIGWGVPPTEGGVVQHAPSAWPSGTRRCGSRRVSARRRVSRGGPPSTPGGNVRKRSSRQQEIGELGETGAHGRLRDIGGQRRDAAAGLAHVRHAHRVRKEGEHRLVVGRIAGEHEAVARARRRRSRSSREQSRAWSASLS